MRLTKIVAVPIAIVIAAHHVASMHPVLAYLRWHLAAKVDAYVDRVERYRITHGRLPQPGEVAWEPDGRIWYTPRATGDKFSICLSRYRWGVITCRHGTWNYWSTTEAHDD